MNYKLFLLSISCLLTFTQPASAYWADDYKVGDSYSGLMDMGPLGVRKHVALPPSEGNWVLVSMNDFSTQARSLGASFLTVTMGRLVFAEVVDEKVVAVLEAKASHYGSDVIWPDMCFPSDKYLFRDNFPGISKPTEKCLIVETVQPSSFADLEKNKTVNFSLKPSSKLIRATATIQGRGGFLQLNITTIAEDELNQGVFVKSYIQWAQRYSDILESALTHNADHSSKKVTGIPHQLADGSIVEYTEKTGNKGAQSHEQLFKSIEKLKEFKDKGILSDEEFRTKRDELLKRL